MTRRRFPKFRDRFLGYHYVAVVVALGAYGAVEYGRKGNQLLANLDNGTRETLYVSLAATSSVMLGFAITAVAIFLTLGPGRGLDLLRSEMDEFGYVRKILMGSIYAFAAATATTTVAIVVDSANHGRAWFEMICVATLVLAITRAWTLIWLLNRLLRLAVSDAKT